MLADVPTNLRKTLYDFFSSNIELKVDLVQRVPLPDIFSEKLPLRTV